MKIVTTTCVKFYGHVNDFTHGHHHRISHGKTKELMVALASSGPVIYLYQKKSGLYILEFPPPPVGGGKKSKGLEMGKEMKGGKKRKKGNLGKI